MSNKETIQSYNTRLKVNNNSLDEILESVNKLPEHKEALLQDKSITITENGTQNITSDNGYDGLANVQVTVQVESTSEVEKPKVLSELENQIISATQAHIDYLFNDYVNGFVTYTDEPVTLYTPTNENMYYMIRSKSNAHNTFNVVWFPKRILRLEASGDSVAPSYIRSDDFKQLSTSKVDSGFLTYYTENVGGYYSQNFSTVDKCIEAIQNPNTTYTKTTGNSWSSYAHEGYKVSYSNLPVVASTNYDILYAGRRISNNETIKVIPT